MTTPIESLRTIFLDRDGVLNRKLPEGCYVRSLDEFKLIDGVAQAIARLNQAGVRVLVVSNQRGVSRGLMQYEDVLRIHAGLQTMLQPFGAHIDGFFFCPHGKNECNCRKPLPGLFEQAKAEFPEVDAASSLMIGDSLSDIEFGHRIGMRTIFVTTGGASGKPGSEEAVRLATAHSDSLRSAVEWLFTAQ